MRFQLLTILGYVPIDHSLSCIKINVITPTKEQSNHPLHAKLSKAIKFVSVGKTGVKMISTDIHLFQFKICKSLVKTRTLNALTSGLIPKRNRLKLPNVIFAIFK